MTIEEYSQVNQHAGELLHQRNKEEAGKLFQSLYALLCMDTYHQRLSGKTFDEVFYGLTPDDVLSLLFNKAVCHLNACDQKKPWTPSSVTRW